MTFKSIFAWHLNLPGKELFQQYVLGYKNLIFWVLFYWKYQDMLNINLLEVYFVKWMYWN